jgi:zinc protease
MRTRLAVLLSLSLAACAQTARYKPKGRPIPYQGHFATFPSGMRLVVYEMPHVDRFTLAVSYGVGSAADPTGKEGLAHLVEHLAFRSAPQGTGAPRIWDRLISSGMRFNAFTSPDHTDYWEIGKPEELRLALALEAARMRDPLAGVSEDEFQVERDVVAAEGRQRLETDLGGLEREWVREVALAGHPYGRPSSETALRRIALADAQAFARAQYGAEGAIVVLASPLPIAQAVALVHDAFGPLAGDPARKVEPRPFTPPAIPPPPAEAPPLQTRRAPVATPHLWLAWRVPGLASGQMTQSLHAAGAVQSALAFRLLHPHYRVYVESLHVGLSMASGAGLVVARIELKDEGSVDKVLSDARYAVEIIKERTWQGQMMASAEDILMESYLGMEEVPAHDAAHYLRSTGRPDYLGERQKMLVVEAAGDLGVFGERHLRGRMAYALLVLPDKNARAVEVTDAAAAPRPSYLDPFEDDAPLSPAPGPIETLGSLSKPGLDMAERRTLPNGLQVVLAKRGTVPIADLRVLLRTDAEGGTGVPAGLPALALGAASAWGSHVGGEVGAEMSRRRGAEWISFEERGSSANMDVLVEALAKRVGNLRVDNAFSFDEQKRRRLRRIELGDDRRPAAEARRQLLARLYAGHAYGAAVEKATLEKADIEDAKAWLRRQMRPERATLVVVSDLTPSPELWAWIESQFGEWSRGEGLAPTAAEAPPALAGRQVVLLHRPGASQALVAVGLRTPPLGLADEPAQAAALWLVESRLERRLRVEEGVTYGVSASQLDWQRSGAFVLAASVERSAAATSASAMLRAIAEIAAGPAPAASVARARWQVARDFSFRFDTVAARARAYTEAALHGWTQDHYEKLPASIAALDAARIQAAAKALGVGREVVVVVGDKEALLPLLRKAGLEPEVVEATK